MLLSCRTKNLFNIAATRILARDLAGSALDYPPLRHDTNITRRNTSRNKDRLSDVHLNCILMFGGLMTDFRDDGEALRVAFVVIYTETNNSSGVNTVNLIDDKLN